MLLVSLLLSLVPRHHGQCDSRLYNTQPSIGFSAVAYGLCPFSRYMQCALSCPSVYLYPWVWQYSWFFHLFSVRPSSFRMRRRSAVSLTGPRKPCGRRSPPLPLLPAGPGWPSPQPGPPSRSRCGTCWFLSASVRLAVSDAINAWAVDSSEESVVDDPFVLITPGIHLSLLLRTLVSSCTLSTTSLIASCWQLVYCSSWPIFNAMSLYCFCNMTLFACSSLPCSSFNRCFLCASVLKG